MPNFERLHELCSKLAALTAPGQQEPGLSSWCLFVGETWQEIVRMWDEDPKRAAAPELYEALRSALNLLNAFKAKPMMQGGFVPPELELIAKWEMALAKARGEQPHAE